MLFPFSECGETMKKRILLSIVVVVLLLAAICGCIQTQEGVKIIEITIGESSYNVQTEKLFLHDVLLEMKESGQISKYVFEKYSLMGKEDIFVKEIDSLENLAGNAFISIYHNIDDERLIDLEYGTDKVLDGTTYFSSGVGVKSLPVYDNAKYLFVVGYF